MPAGVSKNVKDSGALKHMFGKTLLNDMAEAISEVYPSFDRRRFSALLPALETLEMKARVRLIRDELKSQLPSSYLGALKVLIQSVQSQRLKGFALWPYTEFIQTYGLEHSKQSLDALQHLTPLFTSEWAVRPFLIQDSQATLSYLQTCTYSRDVHLRRWASEGSRPRLPWGERLGEFVQNPRATEKLLNSLKYDEELYVRKSVANHLNDIAKDHPDYVVAVLASWLKAAPAEHKEKIQWIVRHALRTLIKAGNSKALKLIGVSSNFNVELETFKILTNKISLGESIAFEFALQSRAKRPQKIVVDYVVYFVKSNGRLTPKVFKLKTFTLAPGERLILKKSHPVRQITTRTYFAGKQALEIQVNGKIMCRSDWTLRL